ncbi:MAG TPA: glycosyltransferase family 39 protein [Candidatus Acidoferrales bacterium]|nr:glycosyltransferase family 39 protein [Candidatus Acidoferrales bacterium]
MKLLKQIFTSLSVIIVVAFILRMAIFWSGQIQLRLPITAMPFGYETGRIAQSIALGKGFSSPLCVDSGPTVWLTPVFPYLLAGVFKIFGVFSYSSLLVITTLNLLISALTCIPIYFIGKKLGGLAVAAVAGWIWVIFPNAIVIPIEWVWDTSLSALMAALILWATLNIRESKRTRDWVGYGLLWGVGLMVNAAIFSLVPFVFIWLVWDQRKQGRTWLQLPAAAALLMAVVCIPWTVRNYVVFHRIIVFRSNFGLELWLGNNDQVPDTWAGFLHPNDYEPEREKYLSMGEIAYMDAKEHEALQFMASHPVDEMRFFWRRFIDNWTGTWDPIQDFWKLMSLYFKYYLVSNILVSLLGLLGILVLSREKNILTFPIAMYPMVFPIVYYITHSSIRYRHPIDPAMVVLTALALTYPARVLARRRSTARPPQIDSLSPAEGAATS